MSGMSPQWANHPAGWHPWNQRKEVLNLFTTCSVREPRVAGTFRD